MTDLRDLFTAVGDGGDDYDPDRVSRLLRQLSKVAGLGAALKPLKDAEWDPVRLMTLALEAPADGKLHQAAAAHVEGGAWPDPLLVTTAVGPKVAARSLLVVPGEDRVLVGDASGGITEVSLADGSTPGTFRSRAGAVIHLGRLWDGTVFAVADGRAGAVVHRRVGPGAWETDAAPVLDKADRDDPVRGDGSWVVAFVCAPLPGGGRPREGQARALAVNLATGARCQVPLPCVAVATGAPAYLAVDGGEGLALCTSGDDDQATGFVVDLASGTLRPPQRRPGDTKVLAVAVDAGGAAMLQWFDRGDGSTAWYRVDASGKAEAVAAGPAPRFLALAGDRQVPDAGAEVALAVGGETVTTWTFPDPDRAVDLRAVDAVGGRIVAASRDAEAVRILEVYGLEVEARLREAAGGAPAPAPALAWARPGSRITFVATGADAQDTLCLEVLDAGVALTLSLATDPPEDAEARQRIVVPAGSLEKARHFLDVSQGSVDLARGRVRARDAFPLLFPRDAFAKLAAGKAVTLEAEGWSGPQRLQPAGRGTVAVEVAGSARALPVIEAEAEETRLAILDDPAWPLVLRRRDGAGQGYEVTAIQ